MLTQSVRIRYGRLWPFLNWALFALGSVFVVAALTGTVAYGDGVNFGDGTHYWRGLAYESEHYRYSPTFYWLTAPFRALPLEAFAAIWTALHIAAVAWLAPWMMAVPFVADDAISGNINTFLAVGVVLAVRGHAWTWCLPLLTKVTPGVGILYHVGRRDWEAVAEAAGVTAVIVLIGVVFAPAFWLEWGESLRSGSENYPNIWSGSLIPRIALGAVLCLLSARWIWLLPVGMVVAFPGIWPSSLALLAAIPRLLSSARAGRGRGDLLTPRSLGHHRSTGDRPPATATFREDDVGGDAVG